jgi:hypothetical protein
MPPAGKPTQSPGPSGVSPASVDERRGSREDVDELVLHGVDVAQRGLGARDQAGEVHAEGAQAEQIAQRALLAAGDAGGEDGGVDRGFQSRGREGGGDGDGRGGLGHGQKG